MQYTMTPIHLQPPISLYYHRKSHQILYVGKTLQKKKKWLGFEHVNDLEPKLHKSEYIHM